MQQHPGVQGCPRGAEMVVAKAGGARRCAGLAGEGTWSHVPPVCPPLCSATSNSLRQGNWAK